MRVLVLGAGGVGTSVARIAARRSFFDRLLVADVDGSRADAAISGLDTSRFGAAQVDASRSEETEALIGAERIDTVLNACDPRLNPPIFAACASTGVTYLDMAMTLSEPHPERPHELPGVMLGAAQFRDGAAWQERGQLALVGIGVEPGMSDVFARHAADHLFSEVHHVGVRDGSDLVVDGHGFAPTFSIWTVIEECLNPPLFWERGRGHFTAPPLSGLEPFDFPEGIGRVDCVSVEHEEVVLIPRWVDCRSVDFKYGLGEEFIDVLQTLAKLGLGSTDPVRVKGQLVSPRDLVAAVLPDPATLGPVMRGKTCAGTLVTGLDLRGQPRASYMYHVVDNEQTMALDGVQAVVWQTALNPVVALELLATGAWSGAGVLGPEAFPSDPFLALLADHGSPHAVEDRPAPILTGTGTAP